MVNDYGNETDQRFKGKNCAEANCCFEGKDCLSAPTAHREENIQILEPEEFDEPFYVIMKRPKRRNQFN